MGSDKMVSAFLHLPDKAVACLLKHLNLWNLMSLRLVCKKTKSWVEDPDVLKSFHVHVKERKFLKALLKSSVQWSNLTISCDAEDISGGWIKSESYLHTFSKLNASLKVLKLMEHRLSFNSGLIMILRNCPNLQSLEVGTLDLSNAALPLTEELLENTKSLERLVLSYVAWENEKDLHFFPQILGNCKKLRVFKIPFILTARLYSLYPAMEEDELDKKLEDICKQVLLKPIIHVLKNSTGLGRGEYSLKYLDVENYDLDQLLPNLLPACKQSKGLVLNVLEALERTPTLQETNLLCDTIGSLLNCTKYLCFDKLDNLRSIAITEDCTSSSDIDKTFKEAPLPSLKSVTLTLTKSILVSARIASCLLQKQRESIEEVSVKFEDLKGSAQNSVFRPIKFASSLPRLRRLCLDGFDGKTNDYQVFWKNFVLLEDLELQNCRTLCDEAFFDPHEKTSPFLSLARLRKVTLEDGEVTDVTLKDVLSKMPLEMLVLSLPKVTVEGLSYLKSDVLTKSLMVFHCMNPDETKEDIFKDYFKHFKNLKKSEILF